MKPTDDRPATFGGTGFRYRDLNWSTDLGSIWTKATVNNDGARLRRVTLAKPSEIYRTISDPNDALLIDVPNVQELRSQFSQLVQLFKSLKIKVDVFENDLATANFIFQRDLFNATPEGVVLARPASTQRRGEEVLEQLELAQIQIPLIGSFRGPELFEGADLLWIDEKTALLGIGVRTNTEAVVRLQRTLPTVNFIPITLPSDIQHLLGLINFVGEKFVGVWEEKLSVENYQKLTELGLTILPITNEVEIRLKRGFNWVCLGEKMILLPSDVPDIHKQLTNLDITVITTDISEYRKCGGGLGCITGILHRE